MFNLKQCIESCQTPLLEVYLSQSGIYSFISIICSNADTYLITHTQRLFILAHASPRYLQQQLLRQLYLGYVLYYTLNLGSHVFLIKVTFMGLYVCWCILCQSHKHNTVFLVSMFNNSSEKMKSRVLYFDVSSE